MVTKYAKWQTLISLLALTLMLVFGVIFGEWKSGFHFHGDRLGLGLTLIVLGVASIVIGVLQIIVGLKENSVLSIVAGVFGIIAFYTWAAIASFVINAILWLTKSKVK